MFSNLKVIELASVLAGPAVGLFFAELGAKVIKIENKQTGGDVTRSWKLASEPKDAPQSAYYSSVNWNKQSLFLNLRDSEDQQKVHDLVKDADIVLANYKPGSAQKLRMDAATLREINPRLIYANLSGFGEDSSRVAFDVVVQAETGFMYMNGQPNSPATKMPVALMDILAAHQLKEGVLLALLKRQQSGKGSLVTVSLFQSAIASLANQATNWLMAGHIPQRIGSLHPNIAPYGEIFISRDQQQLVLSIGTDKQFRFLCQHLGVTELAKHPDYKNNTERVKNRTSLALQLQKAFSDIDAKTILENCHKDAVPIGQIRNMQQVFELPKAQEMILRERLEGDFETKRVKTTAFRIED